MADGGYNSKIGRLGEDLAGQFLENNGYKIVDKNFRTRYGEIDLIARGADEILFLEVKTRSSALYGYPEQAVDAKKISHLLGAAKIYLRIKNLNIFWRLDIISVEIAGNGEFKIKWFKDISGGY
ncbi:MAG: YraN family protein [Candidatus Buchananbacteria bacterium]|nr:YraN family protein [Candidatus Buchananbacteria bacterium]